MFSFPSSDDHIGLSLVFNVSALTTICRYKLIKIVETYSSSIAQCNVSKVLHENDCLRLEAAVLLNVPILLNVKLTEPVQLSGHALLLLESRIPVRNSLVTLLVELFKL